MSAQGSPTQWFLARDGQQFGPISEPELAKFIELGHLQPNDLLWREGFPDWRPAQVVFPARSQGSPRSAPAPQAPLRANPQTAPARRRTGRAQPVPNEDEQERAPRGGRAKQVAVLLVLLAGLAGAGWLLYPYRDRLTSVIGSVSSFARTDTLTVADRQSLEVPPFAGFGESPEATDTKLQRTALWRVIKREFPDWYTQRLNEAATLVRSGKDDAAVGQQMARRIVELRRQQVASALSATMPKLKLVASTFHDNLVKLRRLGPDACFGFISQGEANPAIVTMLQGSEQTAYLQAQLTAVFEAIAEGRKQPRVYPQPRQADYDALAADLTKLGWTPGDMQLFSNERALAQAEPEKVCQMVHDWFAAQIGLSDQDAQMRLLVESLRPVVAG
jgi:GYF domain 2